MPTVPTYNRQVSPAGSSGYLGLRERIGPTAKTQALSNLGGAAVDLGRAIDIRRASLKKLSDKIEVQGIMSKINDAFRNKSVTNKTLKGKNAFGVMDTSVEFSDGLKQSATASNPEAQALLNTAFKSSRKSFLDGTATYQASQYDVARKNWQTAEAVEATKEVMSANPADIAQVTAAQVLRLEDAQAWDKIPALLKAAEEVKYQGVRKEVIKTAEGMPFEKGGDLSTGNGE